MTGIAEAISKLQLARGQQAAHADCGLADFASEFESSMQRQQASLVEQVLYMHGGCRMALHGLCRVALQYQKLLLRWMVDSARWIFNFGGFKVF